MIIVTGATGELGRAIVQSLSKILPVDQIGVSVRDVNKAQDLKALGIRVRHGDFNEPLSLSKAFEGATQVLIVSSNAAASGGVPLKQHQAAIEGAKNAGVKRIVYTSHMAASGSSAFPPARDHHATEKMLSESGLLWTALRHGFYAKNAFLMMGDAHKTGIISVPKDGKVSWTTHADLAEADARILASEGLFNGPTPPLTSAEALDFSDIARVMSQVENRTIRRELISDAELREKLLNRGAPKTVVDIALGFYAASQTGEFEAVDPTLEKLLGRPPDSIRNLIS